jgi:16S rRNA (adenine1518-N6/adenine1519-N6)-dimethyltransferase
LKIVSSLEHAPKPVRNQTISYLTRRFREVGLEPATRHGQNFLIDMNLQRLLVDSAEIADHDVVLEVGTGTGALTALMAQRAAAVVTVEIDKRLFQMASEELIDADNVTMLQQDALKNKNHFAAEVLDTVQAQLDGTRRFKLVANLPYNIATPVVSNLLACPLVPHSMTVTIQKELAERMVAKPSTKDYSHLSIWIQCQCNVEIVRIMPPSVFWPRPKVESAIVHIEVAPQLRERIPDLAFFHAFTRSLFFHRRKFLRSVLVSAFKKRLTKQQVDDVLRGLEYGPDQRAEQLSVDQVLQLCEAMRARLNE